MNDGGNIVIYQTKDGKTSIDVAESSSNGRIVLNGQNFNSEAC